MAAQNENLGLTAGEPADPPPSSPAADPFEVYSDAVAGYLSQGSRSQRRRLSSLAAELAAQRASLTDLIDALWQAARRDTLAASPQGAGERLEAVLDLQKELCSIFEQTRDSERRAHQNLAAAYSQKIREVDAILDNLPALAFMKDTQFRYITVNRSFSEALGIPTSEIISKTDADLFPEEVASKFRERDREVMETGKAIRDEKTVDFDGDARTLLIIKAAILDARGHPTGLIGAGFDITERKRIELENKRLAAALESAGEAIFITDISGRIEYVNRAFERMTCYSREELAGKTPRILKSSRHDAEFFREMWATIGRGEVWQGTVTNRRKDGTVYESDQTIAPVKDEDGKTTHYVAVSRDITERRRMVETLQRAVMVKTEFTSMVSHELRTPLSAIKESIGVVEDLTAGPLNKQQAEFLFLAKRNVDRLHRLINDTLDFSKIERGEFRLHSARHNLNTIAREVVFQQRMAAKQRGLQLELALEESLEPVLFDPDRISQVLVNLIGNAIRYCEGSWIEVGTRIEGAEVIVRVQDSGPGIAEDQLKNIFDPFVQLSTGPGRKVGGTGLGLAISRQIVELHGGRIWVESELGKGSAFYFALNNEQETSDQKKKEVSQTL